MVQILVGIIVVSLSIFVCTQRYSTGAAGAPNLEINRGEILNYLNYNLMRGQELGLLDFVFTLDSYDILEIEIPNRTQVIEYLNSMQSAEGTWTTGQNHYVPITAQVLMFYNRSGVKPEKSLEPFFSTVDTWEEVNVHVNTYNSGNYWGGLWGYITSYVVYKGESPPWTQEFLNEANEKFDTWAYSNHQRTHLIGNLIQLHKPIPRIDEVINIALQQQREDGSWDGSGTETVFMAAVLKLMKNQTTVNQASIDSAIGKGLGFVESCYKRLEYDSQTYAGFAGNPSEQYPNPPTNALGLYLLLNPESDVWSRWFSATANPSLTPTPTSSPSPSPSFIPSPSPSLSPSPSPSSSQQPIPTQKPQPTPSLPSEIIYPAVVVISTAVIATLTLLLRRKRRAWLFLNSLLR